MEEARLLAVKLDNVIIEGKKIHTNLPRFEKFKGKDTTISNHQTRGRIRRLRNQSAKKNEEWKMNIIREGFSYADIVKPTSAKVIKVDTVSLKYDSKEEDRSRFSNAMVAKVLMPGSVFRIQTLLDIEGLGSIKAFVLGPNLCLLEESENGVLEIPVEEGTSLWKSWFSEIRKWKEGDVDRERLAKVRIYGIPCAAWNPIFFESLANTLGSFVSLDVELITDWPCEFIRINLKVKLDFISQQFVKVCVNKLYSIYFLEELGYNLSLTDAVTCCSDASYSSDSINSKELGSYGSEWEGRDHGEEEESTDSITKFLVQDSRTWAGRKDIHPKVAISASLVAVSKKQVAESGMGFGYFFCQKRTSTFII